MPTATITTEVGNEGDDIIEQLSKTFFYNKASFLPDDFEFFVNEKIVFSKHHLGHYPVQGEMIEIARWANRGKSFMHMYLCSYAEGGEPNMVVTDRKNTPIAKRIIYMCSVM